MGIIMGRKKQTLLIGDTETTKDDLVVDFGFALVDLQGNILHSCSVLINGIYTDPVNHPLFHLSGNEGIFNPDKLKMRYANYDSMLVDGRRTLASVGAVNRWLARINATYNPVLTAYNLNFDVGKCQNSGIDLEQFKRRFCLMYACQQFYGHKRKYRKFILENHYFNNRTKLGNMTYQTKAETMARYLLGAEYPAEPHTAIEDVIGYELPLLVDIIKKNSLKWCLNEVKAGNWERFIVKNNFSV
jgi:hypothetical protein